MIIALVYWPSLKTYTVWQYDEHQESYDRWCERVKNNEIYKANHCRIQIIKGEIVEQ